MNNFSDARSMAQRHQASILTAFILAERSMRASSRGFGKVGGGVTALLSPKGCDSCDSSEPKTLSNLDCISLYSANSGVNTSRLQRHPIIRAASQPELTGSKAIICSLSDRNRPDTEGWSFQMRNADGWRDLPRLRQVQN